MLYENYKVYGPYKRKDGRQHIVLVNKLTKKKKTVSYPKYLMEIHIGRYLDENETIDHIDRNFENNEISNLHILSREVHARLDAVRVESEEFECPMCQKHFVLAGNKLSAVTDKRKRGSSGPFCSKSCAGKVRVKGEYDLNFPKRNHYRLEK